MDETYAITEQAKIMDEVDKIHSTFKGRGFPWNRFRGDAVSRVVAHYLKDHLPEHVKLIRLAWINGCENEFDLLIVDKDAEPMGFTGAYPRDKVRLLIEVKTSGVFYKRSEVAERLSKTFKRVEELTGKPIVYLSIWERQKYWEEVLRALGREKAFVLKVDGTAVTGEWERFIGKANALLVQRA